MEEIADKIQDESPQLANFIRKCRYVDDLSTSAQVLEELKKLTAEADRVFASIGLKCKAWTFSGEHPPETVTMIDGSVKVAGQRWRTEVDAVEIPVPALHFGKKQRGKLPGTVKIFQGAFAELEDFVPKKLSRRQVASKMASYYDLMGKFSPLLAGMKVDLRNVVKMTTGWDDPMTPDLRDKWLGHFWTFEKLKGLKFNRARMPIDALSEKMRILTLVDASMEILMVGVWVGFRRPGGVWSCQHLIARALLADENSTIPRNELQSLCGGANLSWIVKQAMGTWVESSVLAGDSEIALCWTTAENKPLSIFHKNRAVQIRRSVNLEDLYHVRTDVNPSDLGTRPSKVTLSDVGPGSRWEAGEDWMKLEIEKAKEMGFIRSAQNLRIKDEQEEDYKKGLTFEKIPELLTRGHPVNERRLSLLEERAEFSQYLILPTKFSFPKVVRIMSIVVGFVSKCRKGRKMMGQLLAEGKLLFKIFQANTHLEDDKDGDGQPHIVGVLPEQHDEDVQEASLVAYLTPYLSSEGSRQKYYTTQTVRDTGGVELVCDKYSNMALSYLYKKGTMEVKQFCSEKQILKIAVEREGLLLSKGRLLDEMNFVESAEVPNLHLGSLGVKVNLPVLERYSPLSYSVAEHIHWDLAKHRGSETCNRISLENVSIIQGATLYKELGENCVRCKIKRKKFLEAAMGPISDSQLTLAPAFWMVQLDLFGPITVKVPGFERHTRNR